MTKALFFDSGDVLVKDGFRSGIAMMERKHRFPVGSLYIAAHDHQYWKDFTLGKITERRYLACVRKNFQFDLDTAELIRVIMRSFVSNRPLLSFIRTLKGRYTLGIISNNPKEWFDYFWENYGWNRIFSVRAVSGYLHIRKPDLRIFHYALK